MKYSTDPRSVLNMFLSFEPIRKEIESQLMDSKCVGGYCSFCQSETTFSFSRTNAFWTNLRGQFSCSRCNLENRFRFLLKSIEATLGFPIPGRGLVFERITPLYRRLRDNSESLLGCEYFGPGYKSGDMVQTARTINAIGDEKIRHEDMQNLSFEADTWDYIIQSDVLEHIPDPNKALAECFRVLKPGGVLLIACPIYGTEETDPIAKLDVDGEIQWVNKPLYHGDPMSSEGVPVFNNFGFDLFDRVREAGFSRVEIGFDYDPLERLVSDNNPFPKTLMWPVLVRAYV